MARKAGVPARVMGSPEGFGALRRAERQRLNLSSWRLAPSYIALRPLVRLRLEVERYARLRGVKMTTNSFVKDTRYRAGWALKARQGTPG